MMAVLTEFHLRKFDANALYAGHPSAAPATIESATQEYPR
jgi:hypothetical protein